MVALAVVTAVGIVISIALCDALAALGRALRRRL